MIEMKIPTKPSAQKRPKWLLVVMYTFPFVFTLLLILVILTWPKTENGIKEYESSINTNTKQENIEMLQDLKNISSQTNWEKTSEESEMRLKKIQADYYKNQSYLRFVEKRNK